MITDQVDSIRKIIIDAHDPLKLREKFFDRLSFGNLTRDEDPASHFCVFFAPFDPNYQQVFLGHHIKGDRWLFNGGHLDLGELPQETLKREMAEECGENIGSVKICDQHLITITNITNTARSCRTHYDLWFFLEVNKQNFFPDEKKMAKEFHQWGWKTKQEALALCHEKGADISQAIKIIFENLSTT